MSPGEPVRDYYRAQGKFEEQERIVKMIRNQICFDHLQYLKCDHGACWSLSGLLVAIEGKK
jgi:hypothetical protein